MEVTLFRQIMNYLDIIINFIALQKKIKKY